MSEALLVEVDAGVAVVTLNRPDRRNALDAHLLAALRHAMAALDADPDVAAVVLTGADPAFCAGLDMKAIDAGELDVAATVALTAAGAAPSPLPSMAIPVIGAVNGVAVTGGLELALRCDFLIASERAAFADTHARLGVQPGWGMTVDLPDAVGIRRAREMSTTGRLIDASVALSWGLVNHVVPHEELLGVAVDLARAVAANEPRGVARLLATYRGSAELAPSSARRYEAEVAAGWVAEQPPVAGGFARRALLPPPRLP